MISEPATLITDYALGVVSAVLGWRLHRNAASVRARRWWALAFAAAAVSALFGGTHHGFAKVMSPAAYALSWKATVLAVGVFSFAIVAGSAFATARGAARTAVIAIAAAQLAAYTAWILVDDQYRYVVLDTAIAMSALLFLHGWSAVSRGDVASRWVLAGIAASAAAAAVQFFGFAPHPHFNHNDLYHLIQLAAMVLLYKGGKLLRDRTGPDGT